MDTYRSIKYILMFSMNNGLKMTNFAYLRVSTNQQDNQNQKLSVLDYCNSYNIFIRKKRLILKQDRIL